MQIHSLFFRLQSFEIISFQVHYYYRFHDYISMPIQVNDLDH